MKPVNIRKGFKTDDGKERERVNKNDKIFPADVSYRITGFSELEIASFQHERYGLTLKEGIKK